MLHKIDYFSYTFHVERKNASEGWLPELEAFLKVNIPKYIETDGESRRAPRRLGFDMGYNFDNHTFIWVNQRGLFLIEHTGAGCDHLHERGLLSQLIHDQKDNATRIDIATDILCDVRPTEFVEQRTSEKTSATGHVKSDSGETCYVGSRKSDRTCKVYRYDGKHPRAQFLRIEYTYKRENAKKIASMLDMFAVQDVAISSGNRYEWTHEVWKLPADATFLRPKSLQTGTTRRENRHLVIYTSRRFRRTNAQRWSLRFRGLDQ